MENFVYFPKSIFFWVGCVLGCFGSGVASGQVPDLRATFTQLPSNPAPNNHVAFRVRVENIGVASASNVAVTTNIQQAGFALSASAAFFSDNNVSLKGPTNSFGYEITALPAGGYIEFDFGGKFAGPGVWTFTYQAALSGALADPTPSNNIATTEVVIKRPGLFHEIPLGVGWVELGAAAGSLARFQEIPGRPAGNVFDWPTNVYGIGTLEFWGGVGYRNGTVYNLASGGHQQSGWNPLMKIDLLHPVPRWSYLQNATAAAIIAAETPFPNPSPWNPRRFSDNGIFAGETYRTVGVVGDRIVRFGVQAPAPWGGVTLPFVDALDTSTDLLLPTTTYEQIPSLAIPTAGYSNSMVWDSAGSKIYLSQSGGDVTVFDFSTYTARTLSNPNPATVASAIFIHDTLRQRIVSIPYSYFSPNYIQSPLRPALAQTLTLPPFAANPANQLLANWQPFPITGVPLGDDIATGISLATEGVYDAVRDLYVLYAMDAVGSYYEISPITGQATFVLGTTAVGSTPPGLPLAGVYGRLQYVQDATGAGLLLVGDNGVRVLRLSP